MDITRRMLVLVLCATAAPLLSGCAKTESTSSCTMTRQVHESPATASPQFVHCVFFTLKPELTDDQVEEFIRDCYALKAIPSVRKLDAGRRDERMKRDVNVTDYQIGLVVYFDDLAGHDVYSDHPIHAKLIEKHKDQWASVRVFDFTARQ